MKVELGSGEKPRKGYVHLDGRALPMVDIICDFKKLPFPDSSVDEFFSRFALEHFHPEEADQVLSEIFRCLKPLGFVHLIVPNMNYFFKLFLDAETLQEKNWVLKKLYGFRKNEYDAHKWGYNFELLKEKMKTAGFKKIEDIACTEKSYSNAEQYLEIIAKK